MMSSGTSWWIVPSRSITKCAHVFGSSCSSESGVSGANVLNVELKSGVSVKWMTITCGSIRWYVFSP